MRAEYQARRRARKRAGFEGTDWTEVVVTRNEGNTGRASTGRLCTDKPNAIEAHCHRGLPSASPKTLAMKLSTFSDIFMEMISTCPRRFLTLPISQWVLYRTTRFGRLKH